MKETRINHYSKGKIAERMKALLAIEAKGTRLFVGVSAYPQTPGSWGGDVTDVKARIKRALEAFERAFNEELP